MSWLLRILNVGKSLKGMGFEKERAALALLPLSFFGIIYFFVALNPPDEGQGRVFGALSICYLVAFLAVAAQWFWGRWFASGLGWSGFMSGIAAMVMLGWMAPLVIFTVLHAVVIAALMGSKMAALYEMQPAWRERYGMDEFGVSRLGKAVVRGSAFLPALILWALGPKEGQEMALAPLLALALAGGGVIALLRMRTWGLLAIAAAGALLVVAPALSPGLALASGPGLPSPGFWQLLGSPLAAAWAALAVLPFARPAWRYLQER
jgi:hypothetical protein